VTHSVRLRLSCDDHESADTPHTRRCTPHVQGSVQARLDAFLAGKGQQRAGCHATETGPGSGFAWLNTDDKVSFISDGVLSMAVQGTTLGLLGEGKETDGVSGAEVRVCARVALGTSVLVSAHGVIRSTPKPRARGASA